MRIVEKDFILTPISYGLFDLTFIKKKLNEEGKVEIVRDKKPVYGASLASCIKRISRHRANSKFNSESVYLYDFLKELVKSNNEILKLCKEPLIENFDTGE